MVMRELLALVPAGALNFPDVYFNVYLILQYHYRYCMNIVERFYREEKHYCSVWKKHFQIFWTGTSVHWLDL